MKEMEEKLEWKKPEVTEFGISENTEYKGGTGNDGSGSHS